MYQFFISLCCWIIFYYMDIPYQFLSSQVVESLLLYKKSYKQWLGSTMVYKCLFNPCYSWKYIINCIIAQFSRSIINYHSDICINENTGNEVPLYLSQLLKNFFCNLWEEEVIASLKAWIFQDINCFFLIPPSWRQPAELHVYKAALCDLPLFLLGPSSLPPCLKYNSFCTLYPFPYPHTNKIFYTCWLITALL